jgi:hypothetical protein
MSATHSSLAPHAVSSLQHAARVAAVQLAGSGMMFPHVAGAVPHSVAHAFWRQTVAAEQLHVDGFAAHADAVVQQRESWHAMHASFGCIKPETHAPPSASIAASALASSDDASGSTPASAPLSPPSGVDVVTLLHAATRTKEQATTKTKKDRIGARSRKACARARDAGIAAPSAERRQGSHGRRRREDASDGRRRVFLSVVVRSHRVSANSRA